MNPETRRAVVTRAAGRCECCGESLEQFGGELDHFEGRRAPESVENCWLLTVKCHRRKTDNIPSAAHWLMVFIAHQRKHGYDTTRAANRLHYVEAKAQLSKREAP